jgi:hypothetical protein
VGDQIERAALVAEQQLAGVLPRRWAHVQAVGVKAERVSRVLDPVDGRDLVVAAWLHDVGYAPALVNTGLHALDGGRWLRRTGWPLRIASLVAHHSCALFEADERGLGEQLVAEFEQEESPTADALWFADMTTGPNGEDLDVLDRLAEVRRRYGPDDPVSRFWIRAKPTLVQAVRRTEVLLATQPM